MRADWGSCGAVNGLSLCSDSGLFSVVAPKKLETPVTKWVGIVRCEWCILSGVERGSKRDDPVSLIQLQLFLTRTLTELANYNLLGKV